MTDQEQQMEPASTHLTMQDVGRILAETREQAALSIEEAAAKLCLRPQQVEALEQGAVNTLPGQTFVRGFIRSYAKLLQLDAGPLVEAHRRHAPVVAAGQISLQCEHIPIVESSRRNWLPYVQAAVVIGMALGAWMVYMDYFAGPADSPPPAARLESEAEALPAPAVETVPVQLPMVDTTEITATVPQPAQPAAAAAASPAPQPASAQPGAAPVLPTAAGAKLKLAFAEQSWVRVRDRDGRDLLNKTASAGGVEEISGMPPFRLEIGNTSGVQLSYNDRAVDLAPYARANVARFTLE